MPDCDWCGTYWDCDGEGGECSGVHVRGRALDLPPGIDKRAPDPAPGDPPFQIEYLIGLVDEDGQTVVPVWVQASCVGRGNRPPLVKLNGHPVTQANDNGGKKVPHEDRHRKWKLNTPFEWPGSVPRVRVQAYPYEGKYHDPQSDEWWPKIWLDQQNVDS